MDEQDSRIINLKGIGLLPMFSDIKVYEGIKYLAGRKAQRILPLITSLVQTYSKERFNIELDMSDHNRCFNQLKDCNDKAKTSSIFDYIEYACSKEIDKFITAEIESMRPKKRG